MLVCDGYRRTSAPRSYRGGEKDFIQAVHEEKEGPKKWVRFQPMDL
jgi:hypothetical protein